MVNTKDDLPVYWDWGDDNKSVSSCPYFKNGSHARVCLLCKYGDVPFSTHDCEDCVRSSNHKHFVPYAFCPECGTPLTFKGAAITFERLGWDNK